ncbi:MAG: hypothetical protein Q9167_002683 [Letrouitia subvulpina]
MGKRKRQRPKLSAYIEPCRRNEAAASPKVKDRPASSQRIVPFEPGHRILLVGEGDFSFAHSLWSHHCCTSLLATCYDSATALAEKYAQASQYISDLEEASHKDDGTDIRILYGVDATQLGRAGAGGGKHVKKGNFDRVIFNFPHVGGLTKDVNRQLELLVGFFRSSMPILAPGGNIVVTIFEGEPYELWNIRDLARHAGLKVGRSFRFQPGVYPGYSHARTLGNIKGGGGWKGGERDARTYVFELQDMDPASPIRKRRRESSSSENTD